MCVCMKGSQLFNEYTFYNDLKWPLLIGYRLKHLQSIKGNKLFHQKWI